MSDGSLSASSAALRDRLSAFVGGFTVQAVRAVVAGLDDRGSPENLLALLVADRLVEEGPDGRLRLSEAGLAAAARARADPAVDREVRDAHLDWAAELAEQASRALEGPEQLPWLDTLQDEGANLRAALAHGAALSASEQALRLGAALGRYWEIRGPLAEGRHWLQALRAANPDAPGWLRAAAANSAGLLALRAGDVEAAQGAYEESLALHWEMGDRLGTAGVLHSMGNLAFNRGDLDESRHLFEEALAIGREVGDHRTVGASLTNLGAVAQLQRDFAGARSLYTLALQEWNAQGDVFNAVAARANLAGVALALGDLEGARQRAEEVLADRRQLGDLLGTIDALNGLVTIARRAGDRRAARRHALEARALQSGAAGRIATAAFRGLRRPRDPDAR